MISPTRAFILNNTRLQRPPHVPELALHLADDVMLIWDQVAKNLGESGAPPPFWAFAWPGGQAIARYLLDHPDIVQGKRVLDFAAGSGICAVAAKLAGACSVLAVDVEPFCADAVALNADANGVALAFLQADLLNAGPPDVDIILAGDVCYEQPFALDVLRWLRRARRRGIDVLVGDPDRAYFPREEMIRLVQYQVPTARGLEDREIKETGVFTFQPE